MHVAKAEQVADHTVPFLRAAAPTSDRALTPALRHLSYSGSQTQIVEGPHPACGAGSTASRGARSCLELGQTPPTLVKSAQLCHNQPSMVLLMRSSCGAPAAGGQVHGHEVHGVARRGHIMRTPTKCRDANSEAGKSRPGGAPGAGGVASSSSGPVSECRRARPVACIPPTAVQGDRGPPPLPQSVAEVEARGLDQLAGLNVQDRRLAEHDAASPEIGFQVTTRSHSASQLLARRQHYVSPCGLEGGGLRGAPCRVLPRRRRRMETTQGGVRLEDRSEGLATACLPKPCHRGSSGAKQTRAEPRTSSPSTCRSSRIGYMASRHKHSSSNTSGNYEMRTASTYEHPRLTSRRSWSYWCITATTKKNGTTKNDIAFTVVSSAGYLPIRPALSYASKDVSRTL